MYNLEGRGVTRECDQDLLDTPNLEGLGVHFSMTPSRFRIMINDQT